MAVRATAEEVKEIIDTTLTEEEVAPFIVTANAFVNARLSDSGLGTALLTEIEKYITAHIIGTTIDPRVAESEIDDVREVYQGKTGYNLQASFYGQIAIALDTTGALSTVGKRQSSITAISLDLRT